MFNTLENNIRVSRGSYTWININTIGILLVKQVPLVNLNHGKKWKDAKAYTYRSKDTKVLNICFEKHDIT